jgi:hypothetical protein
MLALDPTFKLYTIDYAPSGLPVYRKKYKKMILPRQGLPFANWVAPDGANMECCKLILQTGSPDGA